MEGLNSVFSATKRNARGYRSVTHLTAMFYFTAGKATRRGAELGRDVTHTQCQLLVTDSGYRPLVEGLDLGLGMDRVLVVDGEGKAQYREVKIGRVVDGLRVKSLRWAQTPLVKGDARSYSIAAASVKAVP